MLFIIETFFIFIISIKIAALASVGLLVVFYKLKQRFRPLTSLEWEAYFQKMTVKKMFISMYLSFFIMLSAIAVIDGFIFWEKNFIYSITLMCAGIFHIVYKYQTNKNQLKKVFEKFPKK